MNQIVRKIGDGLGFDQFGQLMAEWTEHGSSMMTVVNDLRDKKCCICGNGWPLIGKAFRDSSYVNTLEAHAHTKCIRGANSLRDGQFWSNTLCDIPGRLPFTMSPIENAYAGESGSSWFVIRFWKHYALNDQHSRGRPLVTRMRVGWRKRVWSMELIDLAPEQIAFLDEAFAKENVTKGHAAGQYMIHAHGDQAAVRYADVFMTAIKLEAEKR